METPNFKLIQALNLIFALTSLKNCTFPSKSVSSGKTGTGF